MSKPYTPTTAEVREAAYEHGSTGVTYADFDRWLTAVKAEAWDEGFRTSDQCWIETADLATPDEERTDPHNPYRKGEGDE